MKIDQSVIVAIKIAKKKGKAGHTGRPEQSRDCNRTNVFWHDLFVETIDYCKV